MAAWQMFKTFHRHWLLLVPEGVCWYRQIVQLAPMEILELQAALGGYQCRIRNAA